MPGTVTSLKIYEATKSESKRKLQTERNGQAERCMKSERETER
jgi:hypothetical protein